MKFLVLIFMSAVSVNAFAFDTCEQEAEAAARAMAKINSQTQATKMTDLTISKDGVTIAVTLDEPVLGGQSVTYEATLSSSDPCLISNLELTGEE